MQACNHAYDIGSDSVLAPDGSIQHANVRHLTFFVIKTTTLKFAEENQE